MYLLALWISKCKMISHRMSRINLSFPLEMSETKKRKTKSEKIKIKPEPEPAITWKLVVQCNWSADILKKHILNGLTPSSMIQSWTCNTDQWIPCFYSCQLITRWMCKIRLQAAPTLARKSENSNWWPCSICEDGQVDRQKDIIMVTWQPKFLRWMPDNQN